MGIVKPKSTTNSTTSHSDRIEEKNTKEVEKDNSQSGNVDSGYHSFTCVPSRLCQTPPEMITSLGHEDDFSPHMGYPLPSLESSEALNPTYGNFYSNNNVRTVSKNSLPPSGDLNTVSVATTVPSTNSTSLSNQQRFDEEAKELTDRIQFCLKLGYTAAQIKATFRLIGYNASKNDLLMSLGDLTREVGQPTVPYPEDSASSDSFELVARGPSTIDDDAKEEEANAADNLRPIVIDGSNVAMSHGNKEFFSCKGIRIAVDYFLKRGHKDVTVFVPIYRKEQTRPDAQIKDQELLSQLEADKILVWTPSRHVKGRRITCYDDRFIIRLAEATGGIIVSNDNFRDLQNEKQQWKDLIEKRLLMYSFVSDRFMPPDDPLGRNGPSLDNFLRIRPLSEERRKPECPYGKKCTYGKKCKYFHPEVPLSSVSERLMKRGEKEGEIPVSLAHKVAKELIFNGVSSSNHGASKNDNKQDPKKQEDSFIPPTHPRPHTLRTASPSNLGAYAVSKSPPRSVPNPNNPFSSASTISTDFRNMNLAPSNTHSRSGGYMQGYPAPRSDSNTHSAGASGLNSNSLQQRTHPLAAPPLHYVDRRGGVASSAAPQRTHPHLAPHILHHSSPSAIPSYDTVDPSMRTQYPVTYPTHPSQQTPQHPSTVPGAPSYPAYPYPLSHEMMMYHQNMMRMHQIMLMNCQMQPGGAQTQVPPFMLPPMAQTQPPMMTTNHMAPQPMYGHHSSPPLMPSQLSSSRGDKPPPDQARPGFKDPSSPRYHLFKNLCGLFNRATVEKVMILHPHENDAKKLAKSCLEIEN